MTLLELRGITKDFPGVRALDNVSIEFRSGEIHALVGENGAGKSTLIRIIGGIYHDGSYAGTMSFGGKHLRLRSPRDAENKGIAVIHQELALVEEMSVAENIFLGDEPGHAGFVQNDRIILSAQNVMNLYGLDIDVRSPVKALGLGKKQLVEIAKAMRKESAILVLDEPTAALSDHETDLLLKTLMELSGRGKAIVFVSHRLDEVFRVADRITVLRDGKHAGSKPVTDWTRESVIGAMVGRKIDELFPVSSRQSGQKILEVDDLSVEDFTMSGRAVLSGISFHVSEGEILGIAGLMGSGRSELLSTLFGHPPGIVTNGRVRVGGNDVSIRSPGDAIRAGLAFVPEDRKKLGLILHLSVGSNLSLAQLDRFSRHGLVDEGIEARECEEVSRQLDLRARSLDVQVETLSGGNQQKVVLGKWLIGEPKVLFLDEPTRGIDVGAKAEIYRLIRGLAQRGVGIILVSSELPELLGMCDRIIVLRQGALSAEFTGNATTQEKIMEAAT